MKTMRQFHQNYRDLAKKYTVEVYQTSDEPGLTICRIHVYPEPRKDYVRIVVKNVTWQCVQGTGKTLSSALKSALIELIPNLTD